MFFLPLIFAETYLSAGKRRAEEAIFWTHYVVNLFMTIKSLALLLQQTELMLILTLNLAVFVTSAAIFLIETAHSIDLINA